MNSVRFLDKNRRCRLLNPPELLPTAKQISDSSYRTPSFYIQRTIRVFCRSLNSEKQHRLTECFKNLVENLKTEESCTNIQFEPIGVSLSSPTKNVLEVPAVSQSPTQDSPQRANKRQRSLFDTVVGNNWRTWLDRRETAVRTLELPVARTIKQRKSAGERFITSTGEG